jgi:hypothetical protein
LEEPARLIASPPALLPDTQSGVAQHLGPRAVPEAEGQRDDKDETCPVSTGRGTRRVQLVREGGEGGGESREQQAVGAAAATRPHDADASADRAGADAADDAAALREALLRTKLELVRPTPRAVLPTAPPRVRCCIGHPRIQGQSRCCCRLTNARLQDDARAEAARLGAALAHRGLRAACAGAWDAAARRPGREGRGRGGRGGAGAEGAVAERTTEGEGETEGLAALREALWPDAAPDDGAWMEGPASEQHQDLTPAVAAAAEEEERPRFAAALAAVHAWAEAALRRRAREGAALRRALAGARAAEGAARRALEDERATRQVPPPLPPVQSGHVSSRRRGRSAPTRAWPGLGIARRLRLARPRGCCRCWPVTAVTQTQQQLPCSRR